MFKINLKGVALGDDIDWDELVKMSDGYSGADIANVCRDSSLMQMRRRLLMNQDIDIMDLVNNVEFQNGLEAPISREDLVTAIQNISKSVSAGDLQKYATWSSEFKSL